MAINARSLNNFQVEIKTATHTILADEPIGAGGDDSGPNPYELLLSSLAACKIITVQMYARRKGWELTGIELSMVTHKIHAADCATCESDPNAKVDIIETQIKFLGNLNAEQLDRLKQISEKCPVHRTLTSETKIYTSLMN
ncbi:MAG: OsmC family protein [Anaerolineaceae bacterium]|jgi:putative redox protein|nr:OsmC family protein [Anaerolineaceae bacterium]